MISELLDEPGVRVKRFSAAGKRHVSTMSQTRGNARLSFASRGLAIIRIERAQSEVQLA